MDTTMSYRLLKTILILAIASAIITVPARYLAYRWALSGYFECAELGCGIIAEFLIWPVIYAAFLLSLALLTLGFWPKNKLEIDTTNSVERR